MDSHLAYEPVSLPWPGLAPASQARLGSLPFWGEALATERESGAKIAAYARTVGDPVLVSAPALHGRGELRHATLLETLTARCGVPAIPRRVMALARLALRTLRLGRTRRAGASRT